LAQSIWCKGQILSN